MNRRILNFGVILTATIAATVVAPAVINVFSSNFDPLVSRRQMLQVKSIPSKCKVKLLKGSQVK